MSESASADEPEGALKELRDKAKSILRGQGECGDEIFALAKSLVNDHQDFGYATRLAVHIVENDLSVEKPLQLRQKWALWTSKNPDLPDDSKHDDALDILRRMLRSPLGKTNDPETLGIAGGICKRKWMVDGQLQTLEQSLDFYERGAKNGVAKDKGYTAINAAFVADLLEHIRDPEAAIPCERARELRLQVVEILPSIEDDPAWEDQPEGEKNGDIRWFHETIAEAHFGLRQFEDATKRLRTALELNPRAWEYETTARQFAWLARLLEPDTTTHEEFAASEAWGVLRTCYGPEADALGGSLFAGKLGLALSGGGFRASFFHIGVLAALAELDLLRHVEVLSCVSGGSILGAHYALEIKRLLETSCTCIDQKDYIEAVDRVSRTFLAGVQENIRTRVAFNVFDNARMFFQPSYSRTRRLAKLYQRHLFARLDGYEDTVKLRDLKIRPKTGVMDPKRPGADGPPKYVNWRRIDKIPIVILNATTINTGHNWQFTASWMGEPPSQISTEIDGNHRLRRMYLEDETPSKRYRDFPLSEAVAASSCVPGLFTPLELKGLYRDKTVRLVDGGVFDNQGIGGLLDQDCQVMIVSDASGQLATDDNPAESPLGVLARSNSVTMGSVRVQQFDELCARAKSGRLKGLSFLHLKQELETRDVDWIFCDNPKQLTNEDLRKEDQQLTSYGVMKSVQEKIASLRTDLDSFSDTEAYALMESGYSMARKYVAEQIQGFHTHEVEHPWIFKSIRERLRNPSAESERTEKLLDIGKNIAFKVWHQSPVLRSIAALLGLGAFLTLVYGAIFWEAGFEVSFSQIALSLLALILGLFGTGWIMRVFRFKSSLYQVLLSMGLCIGGAFLAWIHVGIFDRIFLRKGRIERTTPSASRSDDPDPQAAA